MIKYNTSEGQNIQDIVLQFYGSLEYIGDFLKINPDLSIDIQIPAQTMVLIDDSILGSKQVKEIIKTKSFGINNSDENYIADDGNKLFQDGSGFIFQDGTGYEFN